MANLTGTSSITLPKLTLSTSGVKYKVYPTSLSANKELVADTYLMDANCNCNSYKLTFNCNDGNIVIKRTGDYYHTNQGAIDTTNSTASKKVYLTVKNDDTIGTIIPGSTGSPAVLGGSWGNNTQKTNVAVTMKHWEIRWIDNKNFINYSCGTSLLDFEYITFKNCALSSSQLITLLSSNTGSIVQYLNYDNSNSLTSTATFCSILLSGVGSYAGKVSVVANSTGTGNTGAVVRLYCVPFTSKLYAYYIKVVQSGTAYCFYAGVQGVNVTLENCKFDSADYQIYFDLAGGTSGLVNLKNTVLVNGKGIYGLAPSGSSSISLRFFNFILKGTSSNLSDNTRITWFIEACKNSVFDSNTKLCNKAFGIQIGVNQNLYYNNTSETNWTKGYHDISATDPNWGNFSGTLHDDWINYGPGDGWKIDDSVNTDGVGTTNSYIGINTSTQSHTGSSETATTRKIGLAPVFSAFA